jgi:small subunit ribosomal protein S9
MYRSTNNSLSLFKRLASNILSQAGPSQASGFAADPKYQEAVNFLDDVCLRLRRLKTSDTAGLNTLQVQWLSSLKMSERVGFSLNEQQYQTIVGKLDWIAKYVNTGPAILDLVQCFAKDDALMLDEDGQVIDPTQMTAKLDWRGWARATGTRKTAVANCILKPLKGEETGENLVNGKPMHRCFQRFRDLHTIALPLKLTDRLGKYSLEANCHGGGPSGQAGALRLAVSKALVKAEPELRPTLSQHGMLVRDPRMVERKKPGQEKARRKFAWVKR